MPKEKFFSKLKSKDYNSLLEQILEQKSYPSMGKNLILSILYKMETNYDDYRQVKRDAKNKELILQNLLDIVNNKCDTLKLIKPESVKSERLSKKGIYYVENKEEKKLEVFPNEIHILEGLYSLCNNSNMVKNKYGILKDAVTEVLQKGNSCDKVELIRNFNGFSWYISPNEFEDVYANLIFQNIRIIAGNELLEEWISNTNGKKDYIQELKKELERRYNQKLANEIFSQIFVTILKLYALHHKEILKQVDIKEEPTDIRKYIEEISSKKMKLLKKIEKIEKILNDSTSLEKELEKRKNTNTIEEVKEILKKEKKEYVEKIIEYNKKIDPRNFIKKAKSTTKNGIVEISEIAKSKTSLEEEIIKLQILFLEAYKVLIQRLNGKKEVLELIYELRYYSLIPISKEKLIKEEESLQEILNDVKEFLINKGIEEKVINTVNSNKFINLEVVKHIFDLRIINLENTEIHMKNMENGIKVNYLEGDLEETSILIEIPENIGKYKIKEKKKIKIFS